MKKVLFLMGGIGNVLFQLNYAYNLRDRGFNVELNTSLLNEQSFMYKIFGWQFHDTLGVLKEMNSMTGFAINTKIKLPLLYGFISKAISKPFGSACYYGLNAPTIMTNMPKNLFGYFHNNNAVNGRLVADVRFAMTQFIEKQSLEFEKLLNLIKDATVVHVRGGDYKDSMRYGMDKRYYQIALKDVSKCFVVTNDVSYCEDLMSGISVDYQIIRSNNPVQDFIFLAYSRRKVLANSTYSWWASEVGLDKTQIIQKEPFYDHVQWIPFSCKKRIKISVNEA